MVFGGGKSFTDDVNSSEDLPLRRPGPTKMYDPPALLRMDATEMPTTLVRTGLLENMGVHSGSGSRAAMNEKAGGAADQPYPSKDEDAPRLE